MGVHSRMERAACSDLRTTVRIPVSILTTALAQLVLTSSRTTANAHLWDLARRLGFGDEHERALGGRLIQFFSRKKLPVEGTFTVRIAKEDGTTLCLPVWTTRDSPCFTMQKDSVKSQQWHWVTPALEDARRHPAYILAIVPPSHSEETHGTQHTEVVLLWATPPEASREVEYCCSEDVAVVRLDQVGDAIHPRVAGIDDNENAAAEEVPIFDSSVLKLGTMLTSHSKSEVSSPKILFGQS